GGRVVKAVSLVFRWLNQQVDQRQPADNRNKPEQLPPPRTIRIVQPSCGGTDQGQEQSQPDQPLYNITQYARQGGNGEASQIKPPELRAGCAAGEICKIRESFCYS